MIKIKVIKYGHNNICIEFNGQEIFTEDFFISAKDKWLSDLDNEYIPISDLKKWGLIND